MKRNFEEMPPARRLLLMIGVAALVAILIGSVIWSRDPDYKPLFTNLSDRDGGAVIESLQKLNIPYKMAEGGGAILVPANSVYDARLKLAAQGLPKGGTVGFDLMDNMKIGVTQFQENVAYQRALEGEITRTIMAISSVDSARVHLAMPKETVFVRDQQKPSASILVNLRPGRKLNEEQVDAIVHLVASSVPEMPAKSVTIVDQDSNLLTGEKKKNPFGLDSPEMEYTLGVEQTYVKRIENILAAITGPENVRAQVAVDIDFSEVEQTAEAYRPNPEPDQAAVRSRQTLETLGDGTNAAGVPGALSNQPPGAATAPITVSGAKPGATPIVPLHKEATTNYEVDKTISHVKKQVGAVKRLSVAVVVNNKVSKDKKGRMVSRPFTPQELTQVYNLTKEAMGFNGARGDTLNVVNAAFNKDGLEKEELPFWKDPTILALALSILKYLLLAGLALYLLLAVIKPAVYKSLGIPTEAEVLAAALEAERMAEEDRLAEEARVAEEERLAMEAAAAAAVEFDENGVPMRAGRTLDYEEELEIFRQMVKDDPKIVANVIKDWVNRQ
ncbi:MAG: flagellar basal-body MS-ring/collar protein FliF [Methylophilaceae bacterium]